MLCIHYIGPWTRDTWTSFRLHLLFLSRNSKWEKRQRAGTDAQEPEHKVVAYCGSAWALGQSAQRRCGASLTEIFKNYLDTLLCHVLWHDPAWVGRLEQTTHWGLFQPEPFSDSVIQINSGDRFFHSKRRYLPLCFKICNHLPSSRSMIKILLENY